MMPGLRPPSLGPGVLRHPAGQVAASGPTCAVMVCKTAPGRESCLYWTPTMTSDPFQRPTVLLGPVVGSLDLADYAAVSKSEHGWLTGLRSCVDAAPAPVLPPQDRGNKLRPAGEAVAITDHLHELRGCADVIDTWSRSRYCQHTCATSWMRLPGAARSQSMNATGRGLVPPSR